MSNCRYLILTNEGSHYGFKLLNNLKLIGIIPCNIIVRKVTLKQNLEKFIKIAKKIGFFNTIYSTIKMQNINSQNSKLTNWRGHSFIKIYEQLSKEVTYVDDFHSKSTIDYIQNLNVDYIILAQTGIIKKKLIDIPKLGILNAHPGKLPDYRGLDIPWQTILLKKFNDLGSSLHFVDKGIDTGDIVEFKPFFLTNKIKFENLEEIIYEDCIDLLSKIILDIEKSKKIIGFPQRKNEGRIKEG
ncbi:MAG: formyltransferase family protein [Bacteriovoracaceae bacterium]